jgi:hypothetical protein
MPFVYCMIGLIVQRVPLASLYIGQKARRFRLVLVGYNWRVLILLQRLHSLIVRLGRFLNPRRSRHIVPCLQANLGPAQDNTKYSAHWGTHMILIHQTLIYVAHPNQQSRSGVRDLTTTRERSCLHSVGPLDVSCVWDSTAG